MKMKWLLMDIFGEILDWLVFYGISTLVGVYIYIYIMQLEENSNLVKFGKEYHTLCLIRWLHTFNLRLKNSKFRLQSIYCELFYIQVLTMVIITETLTSTSHHDIFTYLDYIFSCYLHTVGFYPYLLSYCSFRKKKKKKTN